MRLTADSLMRACLTIRRAWLRAGCLGVSTDAGVVCTFYHRTADQTTVPRDERASTSGCLVRALIRVRVRGRPLLTSAKVTARASQTGRWFWWRNSITTLFCASLGLLPEAAGSAQSGTQEWGIESNSRRPVRATSYLSGPLMVNAGVRKEIAVTAISTATRDQNPG
jgi:hypothetical protein